MSTLTLHSTATTAAPAPRPGAAPATLRAAKKQHTRMALVRAARSLTRDHGLDTVTVEQICAAAEVSRRTFFNYFDAKEDAILGVGNTTIDPDSARIFTAGGPHGTLASDIVALVESSLGYPSARCEDFKEALDFIGQEPRLMVRQIAWMEREHALLAGLVAERLGSEAPPAEVEIVTLLVMSLIRASVVAWQHSDHQGQPSDHVSRAARILGAALH